MPRRTRTTRIDPDTLTGIQRLIWNHEHLTNDRERVAAARKVSNAFTDAGGCGWCWSELHPQSECDVTHMTNTE